MEIDPWKINSSFWRMYYLGFRKGFQKARASDSRGLTQVILEWGLKRAYYGSIGHPRSLAGPCPIYFGVY
jgi:hypothetical protein